MPPKRRSNRIQSQERRKRRRPDTPPPADSSDYTEESSDEEEEEDILSIAAMRALLPKRLRTIDEQKEGKYGIPRGKSPIGKGGGNYSMNTRFKLPSTRMHEPDGERNFDNFEDEDDPLLSFMKLMARSPNIDIIRDEYAYTAGSGQATSPSLHSAIEIIFYSIERKEEHKRAPGDKTHPLDGCKTSWTCLKEILRIMLTPDEYDHDVDDAANVAEELTAYLIPLRKLIIAMWAHNPGNESNYFSKIRREVIVGNYNDNVLEEITKLGRFEQARERKRQAQRLAETQKANRVLNQTRIDFKEALIAGKKVADAAKSIVRERRPTKTLEERMYTLICAVMFSTGSRLTEVVILSDYPAFSEDQPSLSSISNNLISAEANMLTINPVAKDRTAKSVAAKIFRREERERKRLNEAQGIETKASVFDEEKIIADHGITTKTSDRVVLFGLKQRDIQAMVNKLRVLLRQHNPAYNNLDKTVQAHRDQAIRMVGLGNLNKFVQTVLGPTNPAKNFTVRAFRGIYVVLTFRMWAKQPTSEIMWINTILAHATIATSVSYNTYYLTQVINVLDRRTVESELTAQQGRIDVLQNQLRAQSASIAAMNARVTQVDAAVRAGADPNRTFVKKNDGTLIPFPRTPHRRDGQAARVQRLLDVIDEFTRRDIMLSDSNYRAIGFSSRTIAAVRVARAN